MSYDEPQYTPVISYPTFSELMSILSENFEVLQSVVEYGMPVFVFRWYGHDLPTAEVQRAVFAKLDSQAEALKVWPVVRWYRKEEGLYVARFVPIQKEPSSDVRINYALFVATLGTIAFGGFLQASNPVFLTLFYPNGYTVFDIALVTIVFIASIMGIFFTHEMGHYLTAKKRKIEATLPYFIPGLPELGGTFGAFIRQKSPPKSRTELFDLGVAGPLAGFAVTLVALFVGFILSVPVTAEQLAAVDEAFPDMTGSLPVPAIFILLEMLYSDMIPAGGTLYLHPVGYAAWVGCLVTALNLFPTSQLDGGHALRALVPSRTHKYIGYFAIALMALMGFFLMAILVILLSQGGEHPGPLNDTVPISGFRAFVFVVAMVVLILSIPPLGIALF
ncbi:MAG: site-2 protease family protein [Candidatus Thorarchaeota archaeon]|nr:site-2 protease family protein [Candidatus Thorarchaeota archaeon]